MHFCSMSCFISQARQYGKDQRYHRKYRTSSVRRLQTEPCSNDSSTQPGADGIAEIE